MRRIVILGLTIAIIFAVCAFSLRATYAGSVPSASADVSLMACQQILEQALAQLHGTCEKMGRNKACYGNNLIKAQAADSAPNLKFDAVGDIAAIHNIKSLTTSPLDVQAGTWGLSLMKLQANLPDTLPGQNVTFLVYGDTTVDNQSGDMQSFYFTSGLGAPTCNEAPDSGIIVRSPNHTEVSFKANGVQITIASTVVLKAVPNQSLKVSLLEGNARVSAAGGTQTMKPGQAVTVPMGGANGLEPVGEPSEPVADEVETGIDPVITVMDTVASPDAPINMSVEGCITDISGDTIMISDIPIVLDTNSSVLKKAQVGDCMRVDGSIEKDKDGKPSVKPAKIQKVEGKGSGNNPGNGKPDDANGDMGNSTGNGNAGMGDGNNGNGNSSGNGNSNGNGNGGGGNGNGNSNGNGNMGNAGNNGNGNMGGMGG